MCLWKATNKPVLIGQMGYKCEYFIYYWKGK